MPTGSPWEVLLIAVAGALGALSRYGVVLVAHWLLGTPPAGTIFFPWATLGVNVAGCLAIGILAQLFRSTQLLPPLLFYGLTVGYLGALTTFSTFSLDCVAQAEYGQWLAAAANIAANFILCFAAVLAGMAAVRLLVPAT